MTPPDAPGHTAPGHTAPERAAVGATAASGSRLEATLHEIVQAAVRHVDATYGALGVLTPDGLRLDRFVVAGTGADDRARIGRWSPGRDGPYDLGVPADLHGPEDLIEHRASTGFPPGNPAFLGVPVRVGEAAFGTLYLADKTGGEPFTPADVEVTRALAAAAGLAIQNARLAEQAQARHEWGQAATEMATALLSGADPDDLLRAVSTQVAALTGADMSGVLAKSVDEASMTIVTAVGHAAEDYEGVRLPLRGTYLGALYEAGLPRLIDDISTMPVLGRGRAEAVVELTATFGPGMVAPLSGAPGRGFLAVLRLSGSEPFTADDFDLLTAFAAKASVALELARDQQRERVHQVQADRDRIARDLHDHVVQRIFATALSLDRLGRSLEPDHPEIAARLSRSVDDLHGTIVRIRTTIFELHESEETSAVAVRGRLADVVRSITDGHDLRPELRIRCEPDILPADFVLDLVAVVRELATNVVRHARASRITVSIDITDEVCVSVTDDGCGLPPVSVRSGLANLSARAERRGGTLVSTSGEEGTEIHWIVPLPT